MTDTPTYEEYIEQTKLALQSGDIQEALRSLQWTLRFPAADLDSPERWAGAFQLLADAGARVAGEDFKASIAAIVESPDDVNALYKAGYDLIEYNLPAIAATVLARANATAPGQEGIVAELVAAFEREGWNHAACEVLRKETELLERSFICRYLLVFNSILSGDLKTARENQAHLRPADDEQQRFMVSTTQAMLERADFITQNDLGKLDTIPGEFATDLRAWQFVISATVMLHISREGFDEGMHGRYAFVQDSFELCHAGLQKLRMLLGVSGRLPKSVAYLPERNSEILGHAAAQLFGVEARPFLPENADDDFVDASNIELIVAYDLNALSDERLAQTIYPLLRNADPGRLLFTHAMNWTADFPVAPDVCTFLYQACTSPWGERLTFGASNEVTQTSAMTEDPGVIAQLILDAKIDDAELEDRDALENYGRVLRGSAFDFVDREMQSRARFFVGSPVTSNRFV